ncbi:MAG TPA: co-chaperone GroES family protein [Candidatus Omnitrophota bacterium]|nr:co-chaperone GroES family protein [Candidatus Omnitrophota bacterium]HPT06908.1 co-chaperone GroES family protein [Candidatus Omnitrophota bacterium]
MEDEIIVIGDRCLVSPDEGEDKTDTGLYLPQGVKEKEKVQIGVIVKVGPGYPIPEPSALDVEPWQTPMVEQHYFPLQAKAGDTCIFLRNAGVEIEFKQKKYIVVPYSAILVLVRDDSIHSSGL